MTRRTILTRTASLMALVAASAAGSAAADITGPQVWAEWKAYMESVGYEMSGSEAQSGGSLEVSDVVMTMEAPEGDGGVEITLPGITFTDNPDGTVSVDLPQSIPIVFATTSDDGEPVRGRLELSQSGQSMQVSGEPDDFTYTYDAESTRLTLVDLEIAGQAEPPEDFTATAEFTDMSSVTRMQLGEMRRYDQQVSAGGVSYSLAFTVPEEEGGGTGSLSGRMEGMTIGGEGELPLEALGDEASEMLDAGFQVSGRFAYEAGSSEFDMQPPDGALVGTTSSDGGTVEFAMSRDSLSYGLSQTNLAIDLQQVPDVPFPVSMQLATLGFDFDMPLQETEEPEEFAFGVTLGDLTVSDAIWNLFDPAGQLPRDPATIMVDLAGKVRMLVDPMDPEATAAMGPEAAPGELHALDIRNLMIAAVGAEATGSGSFTFDNTDTTTFNGMPKPLGTLNVRIEGANALIDKLVAMGLLPEEQAMGARMMMGLFGVPQGEDVLTSTIEINEQGHVLANGQRLQ